MASSHSAHGGLHYDVTGTGRPIVLLHGYGLNQHSWRHLVGPLARNHRVYSVDLKGFGASPKPRDGAYSVHDQGRLIADLLVAEALRDVTLIGHSLGGGVALVTTLAFLGQPDRITSLVLIDAASFRTRLPLFVRVVRTPLVGPAVVWLTPPVLKAWLLLHLSYYDAGKIPGGSITAYAATLRGPGARHALVQTLGQLVPPDIEELERRYADITIPTLIIWGRHDAVIPPEIGERLCQTIRNSRLILFEESAHVSHEEIPAPTVDAVLDFLARTPFRPDAARCP